MTGNSLSVTDNRTGKTYEIPIEHGAIRAVDLRQVKTGPDDVGLLSYDPAFMNTASCRSTITYIDGDRGILEYRGYPIEQLAERSSYLEVAYLLIHGQLPIESQLAKWRWEITHHTWIHENLKKFLDTFHHDAHPMAMLVSAVAALSTFYPEAKNGTDADARRLQVVRLIAKMPTLAAFAYRHGARHAVRVSGQRPLLRRQLPQHAVQGDRGEVPAEPGRRAGPRRALHPPRGPRAELLHERRAGRRLVPGRPLLLARRRRRRALRAAPRRRQRGGHPDAQGHRLRPAGAGVHSPRQGRRRAGSWVRAPRLQELRPPGEDHQADSRSEVFAVTEAEPAPAHRARARAHRAPGRLLHPAQALSKRRLLLGPHLRGPRDFR